MKKIKNKNPDARKTLSGCKVLKTCEVYY